MTGGKKKWLGYQIFISSDKNLSVMNDGEESVVGKNR